MKDLLRFTTAGSVDDGKSTLIGRLLHDTRGVYEDQLESVRKASRDSNAEGFDLSLITDGLRAEREQAITIDVAYRYFQTPRRKFIIADTPGHEQYTRNMATGASTASLAVILLDARHGVLPQSRRHAYIAALLGIRKLAVAVNKMDLVDFRRDVFERIRDEFGAVAAKLGIAEPFFVPVSARDGDNVATRGARTPWYEGPSLLEYLETVEVEPRERRPAAFPGAVGDSAAPGFPRLRRADRLRPPRAWEIACWRCPRAWKRGWHRSRARKSAPRFRWPTRSTSAAATCWWTRRRRPPWAASLRQP
jgi:sulfate adenylyltransferase large subunit